MQPHLMDTQRARPLLGLDRLLSFGSKTWGLPGLGLEGERATLHEAGMHQWINGWHLQSCIAGELLAVCHCQLMSL